MFNLKSTFMKKFRMMLPVLAVVFAVVGAVAGSFAPPITQGFYKTGVTTCSNTVAPLRETGCEINLPTFRPVCTVNVAGTPTAYNNSGCNEILRYIPQ